MDGGGVLSHADWLGSYRLGTNASTRTLNFSVAYAPFGEQYAISGSNNNNFAFASLTEDEGLGGSPDLDDAAARELHPNQGRWISPDPAGLAAASLANPQTWNRYAYVADNPLSIVDPSGLCAGYPGPCDTGHWQSLDAMGSQDDGCYLTFSCTVYVDQNGMAYDTNFSQALLHMGAATTGLFPPSGYASSAGGLVHQYSDGSEVLLSDTDIAELGFGREVLAERTSNSKMFLAARSDSCNPSGRNIIYSLEGRGKADYYVREILTENGSVFDNVRGAE